MKNFIKPILLSLALATTSVFSLSAQTVNGVLEADPQSLSFETYVNEPVSQTVDILVLNESYLSRLLSPLIAVDIEGTNASQFSIDTNNVTVIDILNSVVSGAPIDIEVTYNPTSAGIHSAALVIKTPSVLGLGVTLLSVPLMGVAH